jgi:hypothetical protein
MNGSVHNRDTHRPLETTKITPYIDNIDLIFIISHSVFRWIFFECFMYIFVLKGGVDEENTTF